MAARRPLRNRRPTPGWTNPGTEERFVYLDLNRNGIIDGGQELFGDVTFLPAGGRAQHGFEALAAYDDPRQGGNGDGSISAGDRIWGSLREWIDRNHDAVATHDENHALPSLQIVSISLTCETLGADRDLRSRRRERSPRLPGTFPPAHHARPGRS